MLTKEERELLSQIACDNETGNHLLGRKRPAGYWELRNDLYSEHPQIPKEKQELMLEYVKQSSDYAYYMSLPPEKRMF